MENNIIKAAQSGQSPFDSICNLDEKGIEFWLARELMGLLGYEKWQKFERPIAQAIENVELNGDDVLSHFLPLRVKSLGRNAKDYQLSRYGCYMVALCCDGRKIEVASAKKYFAIKTREAEIAKPQTQAEILLAAAQQMVEIERRQLANERKTQELETIVRHHDAEIGRIFSPNGHYFSVMGYANLLGRSISISEAARIGRLCSKASKLQGIAIEQLTDPRFGRVNSYPESILQQYFD